MDSELQSYVLAACESAISITNHELLSRQYIFETTDQYNFEFIKLPVYPVSLVSEVLSNSEVVEFENKSSYRPGKVKPLTYSNDYQITYTAGYATSADIPYLYLMAIKQIAGYMYDNRGCDMGDAINNSGAKIALDVMRVRYDTL
jgi:hypothetical protein